MGGTRCLHSGCAFIPQFAQRLLVLLSSYVSAHNCILSPPMAAQREVRHTGKIIQPIIGLRQNSEITQRKRNGRSGELERETEEGLATGLTHDRQRSAAHASPQTYGRISRRKETQDGRPLRRGTQTRFFLFPVWYTWAWRVILVLSMARSELVSRAGKLVGWQGQAQVANEVTNAGRLLSALVSLMSQARSMVPVDLAKRTRFFCSVLWYVRTQRVKASFLL